MSIYSKLKPKRKYHKTPPCGHTDGYCDMEHCRERYAIKAPKVVKKIDEYLHHRLNKLDSEVQKILDEEYKYYSVPPDFRGEYGKRKQEIKRYKKMFWKVFIGFWGLVFLYPILILIWDIII